MSKKKKKGKKAKEKVTIPVPAPETPYAYELYYNWEPIKTVANELSRVRHTRTLLDPFPEHSAHSDAIESGSKLRAFFGLWTQIPTPKEMSIWEAYRMGYDKAFEEIEAAIGSKEIK